MLTTSKFIFRFTIALFLLNLVLYSQDKNKEDNKTEDEIKFVYVTQKSNEELKLDFAKVTFKVTLEKNNFIFLEPLVLRCKFSNPTDKELEFDKPILSNDLELQIRRSDGNTFLHKDLFAFYINRSRPITRLSPGESIEEIITTKAGDDRLFNEAGNFQLKFSISNGEKKWSNATNVIVDEPQGEDLEVWNQIKGNKDIAFMLQRGSFTIEDENRTAELMAQIEKVVTKFPNSVYSGYLKPILEKYKVRQR